MNRFSYQKLLWVLSLVVQLAVSAPQGNSQFPDNYSVYVRALQNQNQPAATPSPYSAPIQAQNHGGYSPPLLPQAQPYRPPLIPHIQPDFNHHQGNYGRPQPNILQPSQQQPQQPQVRNFPQYQPPLSNPFKPAQPSQPQHNQHNQHNNNQQVIYVGGQQSRPYNPQPPQPPAPSSNSGQAHHQQPSSNSNGQPVSFSTSFTSDAARQGKVVSGQAPAQAIQKAPASEIQFDKGAVAKDKDASNKKKDDEYVIYYYYYYDDENKKKENNLTLNFDDIPNLEQYDSNNKTQGGRSNVVANGVPNSLQSRPAAPAASHQSGAVHNVLPGHNDYLTTASPRSATAVSVSVSVSEGPQQSPVPNVYRYGNSEIPRSPIIKHGSGDLRKPAVGVTNGVPVENHPNTVVSIETKAPLTEVSSTTPSALHEEVSEPSLEKPIEEANDVGDTKKIEVKKPETPEPETTTTTEASTTEEPATTTESKRRAFGNRRRNGGVGSNRISPTRRPSTSTTTTEASAISTRRTPRPRGRRPTESARIRPTRPRGRTTPAPTPKEEEEETHDEDVKTSSTTQEPDSTTATSRRFGSTNRRFTPSRTGSRASTTPAPTERSPVRPITPRPRAGGVSPRGSSLFGRTRPPGGRVPGRRPPFSRAKPVVEEKAEEEEDKEVPVSSSTAEAEEASKTTESGVSQSSTQATSAAAPEVSEPEEGDKEESEATEAPVSSTTEASRRNPLFRTRTRAPLFSNNRARPNPLSRSRPTAAPSK